jgi:hypothetical protein
VARAARGDGPLRLEPPRPPPAPPRREPPPSPKPPPPVAKAAAPSPPAIDPRDRALWRFLWGAGSRRLHVTPSGRPAAGAPFVEGLDELLALFGDVERPPPEPALRGLLAGGLLEDWLSTLGHGALAGSTGALRRSAEPRKLARWLDLAARTR